MRVTNLFHSLPVRRKQTNGPAEAGMIRDLCIRAALANPDAAIVLTDAFSGAVSFRSRRRHSLRATFEDTYGPARAATLLDVCIFLYEGEEGWGGSKSSLFLLLLFFFFSVPVIDCALQEPLARCVVVDIVAVVDFDFVVLFFFGFFFFFSLLFCFLLLVCCC